MAPIKDFFMQEIATIFKTLQPGESVLVNQREVMEWERKYPHRRGGLQSAIGSRLAGKAFTRKTDNGIIVVKK